MLEQKFKSNLKKQNIEYGKKDILNKYKKHKKFLKKALIGAFFVIVIFLFVRNNYFLYDKAIGTIIENKTVQTNKNQSDAMEKEYEQTLKIKIRNTSNKGKIIKVKNRFTYSKFQSSEYKKGQDVFLHMKSTNGDKVVDTQKVSITQLKLDYVTITLIAVFGVFVFSVISYSGLLIMLSLAINGIVFVVGLKGFATGKNLVFLTIIMTLLFIVSAIIILNGFSIKSIGTILSSIVTVSLVAIIYALAYVYSPKLSYEYIPYTIGFEDLETLYHASLVFGILGAVTDVAITINSATCEILNVSKKITFKKLVNSIQEIGFDIMGTMISVVFFSFICGEIPLYVLKMKNGFSFLEIMRNGEEFEIIRFLVGAIGIVLAIPVSACIAVLLNIKKYRKVMVKEVDAKNVDLKNVDVKDKEDKK
ncbi:YibE/F family protein [Lachnobacterium bovis]|uniref:Uncharacterized membrane protein n=1 Tax=Lachnobacterium bovis TaxID=140626 RepID=A0A1H9RRA2_9FIRM|nr:YibE/F family protein [Lachnobacterium bovis]SER75501.1 Uncharacterized membrane protein [Lachnobacterium bovis]